MNHKFDELAKGLAQSVTRRQALKRFGVGLAGMVLACFGVRTASASLNPKTMEGYCQVFVSSSGAMVYGSCFDPKTCVAGRTSNCPTYQAVSSWESASCLGLGVVYYDPMLKCKGSVGL